MQTKSKKTVSQWLSDLALPILLVAMVIFFSVVTDTFFSQMNIMNILRQNVHVVVVTCAVLIIMISGGCDLSIGYQMSVACVLAAKLITLDNENPVHPAIAVILAIVLCSLLGTFNGFIALKLKSNTMIVTLATMAIFQGISFMISNTSRFSNFPDGFKFIGQGKVGPIPVNVIIMIVVVVLVGFFMHKTSIGRKVYAAGDNPEAARLAGLNVSRIKILSFTVAGVIVGIGAVLYAARQGSVDSGTAGPGIEFTGIIACVLSGVALKGGEGTLWKAVVAAFILGVLSNGMTHMGLDSYPQYIAQGVIMLLSLYLTNRNQQSM